MDRDEIRINAAPRAGAPKRTGRTCFVLGLTISVLLHVFLGVQTVRSRQEAQKPREERLVLELVRKVRWVEKGREKAASPKGAPETGSSLPNLQPREQQKPSRVYFGKSDLQDELLSQPLTNPRVRKVLQLIQRKVDSLWRRADPPGLGTVELRLKLSPEGKLVSLWITKLRGDSKLADFLAALLKEAAPYTQAMGEFAKPLVLDCRFEVDGSDMG